MKVITGEKAVKGLAIGPMYCCTHKSKNAYTEALNSLRGQAAYDCFLAAREELVRELGQYEDPSSILAAQAMLLQDELFREMAEEKLLAKGCELPAAIREIEEELILKMQAYADPFFAVRGEDIRSTFFMLLQKMDKQRQHGGPLEEKAQNSRADIFDWGENSVILAADQLYPVELLGMRTDRLLGLVLEEGSPLSHTVILAEGMGIPVICGISLKEILEAVSASDITENTVNAKNSDPAKGTETDDNSDISETPTQDVYITGEVILDGDAGRLFINPEEETVRDCKKKLLQKSGMRTGKQYVNISMAEELTPDLLARVAGVGLYRSEIFYMKQMDFPGEEQLFEEYRRMAVLLGEKPLVIRTLDIGGDKMLPYYRLEKDMDRQNFGLQNPKLLKVQLRAICRAAAYGNVSVMYPMIRSTKEVLRLREIAWEAEEELRQEGLSCRKLRQGIMIETPEAVAASEKLARLVDFVSIGSNDLMRQCGELAQVLAMIRQTAGNAHKAGIACGICGRLAERADLADFWAEVGIDDLSLPPA